MTDTSLERYLDYILAHQTRLTIGPSGQLIIGSAEAERYIKDCSSYEIFTIEPDLSLIWLSSLPKAHEHLDLRAHLETLNERSYRRVARAQQLLHWRKKHRFCGACAHPLEFDEADHALHCTQCGNRVYPRISPCIIVLIEDGDRILLAHNTRFTTNRFSTLAGFVEAGETAEEAVAREIKEEVGVDVGKLRYFKSQAWPFPDSLMLAFFAEYQSGEIVPDGIEISEGRWFRVEDLESVELPPPFAISRQLIDDWVKRHSG